MWKVLTAAVAAALLAGDALARTTPVVTTSADLSLSADTTGPDFTALTALVESTGTELAALTSAEDISGDGRRQLLGRRRRKRKCGKKCRRKKRNRGKGKSKSKGKSKGKGRGKPKSGNSGPQQSFSVAGENPNASGEFVVCLPGGKTKSFGKMDGRKPEGITVYKDGGKFKCKVGEYAGGFDGYFSTDAGDGHEDGFARAVAELLGVRGKIGKGNKKSPANAKIDSFLKKMRSQANPVNLDFPKDREKANAGARMANIRKVQNACTDLITVKTNC